jgi:Flp pilus assembly protein TadD
MKRLLAALFGLTAIACARGDSPRPPAESGATVVANERARIREFWAVYRDATSERIAGRPESAAAGYVRALVLNPDHEDGLYYLGSMQLALGEFAGAESAWRRLVVVNPSSARAHSQLGGLYLCLDQGAPFQLDSAEVHFRLAHEINMEETGPSLHLGEAALMRGDLAGASGWFRTVLGSHPNSTPAHFYGGYIAWKRGDLAAARLAFGRAIAAAKSGTVVAAVPGEGDTHAGATPMTAARLRCGQLDALRADLELGDARPELATRYGRLDSLLSDAGKRRR